MNSRKDAGCPSNPQDARTLQIRKHNDRLRVEGAGGRILFTNGVTNHGVAFCLQARLMVANFDQFGSDNDPYGERDFGAVCVGRVSVFWKIDYYDDEETFASSDASDPAVTSRILTIMLADEY